MARRNVPYWATSRGPLDAPVVLYTFEGAEFTARMLPFKRRQPPPQFIGVQTEQHTGIDTGAGFGMSGNIVIGRGAVYSWPMAAVESPAAAPAVEYDGATSLANLPKRRRVPNSYVGGPPDQRDQVAEYDGATQAGASGKRRPAPRSFIQGPPDQVTGVREYDGAGYLGNTAKRRRVPWSQVEGPPDQRLGVAEYDGATFTSWPAKRKPNPRAFIDGPPDQRDQVAEYDGAGYLGVPGRRRPNPRAFIGNVEAVDAAAPYTPYEGDGFVTWPSKRRPNPRTFIQGPPDQQYQVAEYDGATFTSWPAKRKPNPRAFVDGPQFVEAVTYIPFEGDGFVTAPRGLHKSARSFIQGPPDQVTGVTEYDGAGYLGIPGKRRPGPRPFVQGPPDQRLGVTEYDGAEYLGNLARRKRPVPFSITLTPPDMGSNYGGEDFATTPKLRAQRKLAGFIAIPPDQPVPYVPFAGDTYVADGRAIKRRKASIWTAWDGNNPPLPLLLVEVTLRGSSDSTIVLRGAGSGVATVQGSSAAIADVRGASNGRTDGLRGSSDSRYTVRGRDENS